jgi:hypothetical protein
MRLTARFAQLKFWQVLIAALLFANLTFMGARIALAGDFEGGDNPFYSHMVGHLGCVDDKGNLRVFLTQHSTYGTNPPHDACKDGEQQIGIFLAHN